MSYYQSSKEKHNKQFSKLLLQCTGNTMDMLLNFSGERTTFLGQCLNGLTHHWYKRNVSYKFMSFFSAS